MPRHGCRHDRTQAAATAPTPAPGLNAGSRPGRGADSAEIVEPGATSPQTPLQRVRQVCLDVAGLSPRDLDEADAEIVEEARRRRVAGSPNTRLAHFASRYLNAVRIFHGMVVEIAEDQARPEKVKRPAIAADPEALPGFDRIYTGRTRRPDLRGKRCRKVCKMPSSAPGSRLVKVVFEDGTRFVCQTTLLRRTRP